MAIEFIQEYSFFELNEESLLHTWLEETILDEGFVLGEINFIYCSDEYLLDLNKKHLNHDYYTDVITFDFRVGDLISADIFISVDRVRENAKDFLTDFNTELNRMMIHGMLHLMDYNDKSEDEKVEMTEKENYYLGNLKAKKGGQK